VFLDNRHARLILPVPLRFVFLICFSSCAALFPPGGRNGCLPRQLSIQHSRSYTMPQTTFAFPIVVKSFRVSATSQCSAIRPS
jgi:hypothetical protein